MTIEPRVNVTNELTMWITAAKLIGDIITFLLLLITVTCLIFSLYRYLVGVLLSFKYGNEIEIPTGPDVFFSLSPGGDQLVAPLFTIYKGQYNLTGFRNRILTKWVNPQNPIDRERFRRLRSRCYHEMGYFYWKEDPNFRIEDHVTVFEGPKPKNDRDLYDVMNELLNTHFPIDIPPWLWVVVPLDDNYSNLEPGPHYATILRFRHCLCDGVSIMYLVNLLVDEPYEQLPISRAKSATFPQLFWYWVRFCTVAPFLFLQLALARDNNILSLPGKLNRKSMIDFTPVIPKSRFIRVKSILKCTVNELVMSCVTGAFRAHFIAEQAPVPDYVTSLTIVSKHDLRKPITICNYCSFVPFKCPVNAKTPLERVEAVKRASEMMKNSPLVDFIFVVLMKGLSSFLPSWVLALAADVVIPTGVVSNLVGGQAESTFFGHEFIRTGFIVPIARNQIGIGFSVLSSKVGLQIGIKVDYALFKDQEVFNRFLKFITDEFEELENIASTLSIH